MMTPAQALARMFAILGTGEYLLGGTDLPEPDHSNPGRPDAPRFRPGWRMDCLETCLWAYDIPKHQPGYMGYDWVNTDSACLDAAGPNPDLFTYLGSPGDLCQLKAGDLIVYPSDHAHGVPCGHAAMVAGIRPSDGALTLLQCHGPNGAKMLVQTDDSIFRAHEARHPGSVRYLRVKQP